jgi:hypothetical protein
MIGGKYELKDSRSIVLNVILSAISVFALTFGIKVNWPDFVHVNHGFPLRWRVHTLSKIAGPVNLWSVNITALALDIAFWLALILLIQIIVPRIRS